eukprot:6777102-Heterocapsa_arctica.AAC.1
MVPRGGLQRRPLGRRLPQRQPGGQTYPVSYIHYIRLSAGSNKLFLDCLRFKGYRRGPSLSPSDSQRTFYPERSKGSLTTSTNNNNNNTYH